MLHLQSATALFLILNLTRGHSKQILKERNDDNEFFRHGRGLLKNLGLNGGDGNKGKGGLLNGGSGGGDDHKGKGGLLKGDLGGGDDHKGKGGLLKGGLGGEGKGGLLSGVLGEGKGGLLKGGLGGEGKGGLLKGGLVGNLVQTLDTGLLGQSGNRRKILYGKPGSMKKASELPLPSSKYRVLQNARNETYLCSKPIWNMEFQKHVTFSTENFGQKGKTYSPKTDCTVLYMGSQSCTPVISCETPIHLSKRVDGACKDEFLYITDGLGGGVKYCDSDKINRLVPSNEGKDFYVQLVTGQTERGSSLTGFKCTVTCKTAYQEVTPLRASKKSRKYMSNCVCGLQSKRGESHRIVGGVAAEEFEFPWLVAIVLKQTRQPVCGGAIINDRHILTAAHCFALTQLNATDVDILIHAHVLEATISGDIANVPLGQKGSVRGIGWNLEHKSDADENSTRISVDKLICHPMFSEGYDNDICIMQLNQKIDLATETGATPICLPNPSPYHDSYNGKLGLVAGWGLGDEDASASNRLLQKLENIPIIAHNKCKALLEEQNETISDKMMCAGFLEGGKDSCTGDSGTMSVGFHRLVLNLLQQIVSYLLNVHALGGPLILKQPEGQYTQIGVVSWGSGCARKKAPGVYTDVQQMMAWVNFHTSDSHVQWCQESVQNDE